MMISYAKFHILLCEVGVVVKYLGIWKGENQAKDM